MKKQPTPRPSGHSETVDSSAWTSTAPMSQYHESSSDWASSTPFRTADSTGSWVDTGMPRFIPTSAAGYTHGSMPCASEMLAEVSTSSFLPPHETSARAWEGSLGRSAIVTDFDDMAEML